VNQDSARLADDFRAVFDELVGIVERCGDEQWRSVPSNEQRSVAVLAYHVAVTQDAFYGITERLAAGETYSPTVGMDVIDRLNAEQAREHAGVEKSVVVETLRAQAEAGERQIRALTGEDLSRGAGVYGGNELTVGQVVEWITIGHAREHLGSIRSALLDDRNGRRAA
jgi:hypothetical protein